MTSVVQLLSKVSEEVGAVKKKERNTGQNFNFRGIDTVVLATYPAFVKHGIIMVPEVLEQTYDSYSTAKGARMAWIQVLVRYTFYGPDGDFVVSVVPGEAADSADKGMSKAMSVAKRTALLQVLHLPTDDPDPDSEYVERGDSKPSSPKPASKSESAPDPTEFKRAHVTKLLKARKVPVDHLKAFLVELGDYSGLSAVNNVEHLDSVRNWVEQAYPEGK